jgi:hypothetical protein
LAAVRDVLMDYVTATYPYDKDKHKVTEDPRGCKWHVGSSPEKALYTVMVMRIRSGSGDPDVCEQKLEVRDGRYAYGDGERIGYALHETTGLPVAVTTNTGSGGYPAMSFIP